MARGPYPASAVRVMHLDMDSYFATAEQQARPSLRGKPVGIAIANSPGGTIIAASLEAKKHGVGTGTKVGVGKQLIPGLVILRPNPGRYRVIHRRIRDILRDYSDVVRPRSIDELSVWLTPDLLRTQTPLEIGAEIKQRIRDEVGDWLGSSVGIAPNWFLAKTGSGFDKPNGLTEITRGNTREILGQLKLRDLCGIAARMEARLNLAGIASPQDLYDLPPWELKRRLGIVGYYWHLRLHGYAIDTEDNPRRTLGHSSVIPRPTTSLARLKPLLTKLCERAGRRLRAEGLLANGVAIYGRVRQGAPWKASVATTPFDDSLTLTQHAYRALAAARRTEPVGMLAVTTFNLQDADPEQLSLFDDRERRQAALAALDQVNDRWGELTMHPASMWGVEGNANDSIAFGQDMAHEAKR